MCHLEVFLTSDFLLFFHWGGHFLNPCVMPGAENTVMNELHSAFRGLLVWQDGQTRRSGTGAWWVATQAEGRGESGDSVLEKERMHYRWVDGWGPEEGMTPVTFSVNSLTQRLEIDVSRTRLCTQGESVIPQFLHREAWFLVNYFQVLPSKTLFYPKKIEQNFNLFDFQISQIQEHMWGATTF